MAKHEQTGGKVVTNSIVNFAGQIILIPIGIVTIPYIVRGLGTDGYGILSIAWMVLGYFSIFDLGLSRATVKFVAENMSQDKIHNIPDLVWTSLCLITALGCIGGLLVAAFVPLFVTRLFTMPQSFVGEAKTSLLILCAGMPVMLGGDALRGVLEAAQRFDLVNLVKVPASILFYLLAALVIPLKVPVSGIVLLMVLVRLISGVIYLVLCFRVFPNLRTRVRFSKASIKPLTVFGGWIMVSNITGPLFGYLERFVIASALSVGMLAFYSAPFDLVGKIIIIPASIVPALFPYFSYHGSRTRNVVSDVTTRTVQWLIFLMTPLVAVFYFFAREILQLWLGPQFANTSTGVVKIITVLFFLNAFAYIPYTSVQALGRPDLKAKLDLAVLPTFAISAVFFMRWWGLNGAAFAKLFITIIDVSCLFWFARKIGAFSIRDCLSAPMLRTVAGGGALLTACALIERAHLSLLLSGVCVVISCICYVIAFWLFVLDDKDKTAITDLLESITGLQFAFLRPTLRRDQVTDTISPVTSRTPTGETGIE